MQIRRKFNPDLKEKCAALLAAVLEASDCIMDPLIFDILEELKH